jgi:superfamily II RNA helicase
MRKHVKYLKYKSYRTRKKASRKPIMKRPRLAPELRKIFKSIGTPLSTAFRPDPFQLNALEALRSGDVLVTAPTGSGKTWIAEQAVREYLVLDRRCWYASPLKALSNSKYQEFSQIFGSEKVGILTGDRKENPDAPVIIGTTEILRNQLYDAMMEGQDLPVDLAILDEAHYLNDQDRGVVWEEVLIYLPERVRVLLLSATIGNRGEIKRWLEEIREGECHVVQHEKRPVPLHPLFLFPDGELTSLATNKGVLPKIKRFLTTREPSKRAGSKVTPQYGWLIEQMRKWDLLPAIFFLKSRADCDLAIQKSLGAHFSRQNDANFKHELYRFLQQYPFLKHHRQLSYLEKFRVGSHHGGQLPHWKLLVEEMMNQGYLDAIFSTSTVAAGVNFPARTVVLVQSDRFDGRKFSDLTATELHQMTGRAGRRGKDRIGFALVLPGLYQDPLLIHQLTDSPPEPVKSQIQISFSMVLNLLLSHHPASVQDLLDRSLASFQDRQSHPELREQWRRLMPEMKRMLPKDIFPQEDPVEFLRALRTHTGLRQKIQALRKSIALGNRDSLFSQYLKRGRLFVDKKGEIYVAFHTFLRREKTYCAAHRLTGTTRTKRNQIKPRKIPVEAIRHLIDYRVDIKEDVSGDSLNAIFASIPLEQIQPLGVKPGFLPDQEKELHKLKSELAGLPDIPQLMTQLVSDTKRKRRLRELERLALRTDQVRHYLWNEFNRHLDFLRETGFVDEKNRLTADGRWASCLRLDHPLLIAEAIRRGLFDDTNPTILAGLMAPFVVDRIREVEVRVNLKEELLDLGEQFAKMVQGVEELQRQKRLRGFDTLQIQFWPAASLYLWASGFGWEELLGFISVEEGDMAMLILRGADHLRQLFDLGRTHQKLANTARKALPLILREPVLIA